MGAYPDTTMDVDNEAEHGKGEVESGKETE